MPLDTIADPRFIVLTWAAGLALVVGVISTLRIVGTGFTWLVGGTAGTLGLVGLALGVPSRIALGLMVVAMVLARQRVFAGGLMLAASIGYLVDAATLGGWALTLTAALALGGVTGEMSLGHWYLVDPRLPRWALRGLAWGGIVGLLADGLILYTVGEFTRSGATVAYLSLLAMSVLLMLAVLGALRYPAYAGVMAATGLSYLAVLTSLGAVFVGRAMVAGVGPFS